jgi:hypothetical protein
MRNLAFSVLVVAAVSGSVVGCGGSSTRKPGGQAGSTGTAGSTAGSTGTAGSTAGTTGTAGSTATAGTGGDTGTAGAGGSAGAAGAGGSAGAAGAGGDTGTAGAPPPPPPTYCETHPVRALPYNIAQDFKVVHILNNNNSGPSGAWVNVASADCSDNPVYPPFVTPTDGGAAGADGAAGSDGGAAGDDGGAAGSDGGAAGSDGGAAGSDGGAAGSDGGTGDGSTANLADDAGVDDAATDAAASDASADAPVADASADAAVDAPADAPASDAAADGGGGDAVASNDAGGGDGGAALPACYEFAYNPALCTGTCWAGVVFQIDDMQPAHPNGVCIAPGANTVEWYARASKANARVKFGFIGEGVGTTEQFFNVPTTWMKFSMPIDGTNQSIYNTSSDNMNGVWNAFSVVVEPQDHAGGTYIEVKDIRWMKQ